MSFVRINEFERHLCATYKKLGVERCSVLLAVSGGADSTALMHASHSIAGTLGLRLHVVSFDHGLRKESKLEMAEVQRQALALNVGFTGRRLVLPSKKKGIEAAAREARYSALKELREQLNVEFVATAHTASDQAETLVMRLIRGSSLRDASGIRERGNDLVRPMLFATRAMVEEYLKDRGLSFVLDSMNSDAQFFRVRVRTKIIPVLNEVSGFEVTPHLANFARYAEEDDAWLQNRADSALRRVVWVNGSLDRIGLKSLERPILRRVLASYLISRQIVPDAPMLEEAMMAIDEVRNATLAKDRILLCSRSSVRVTQANERRRSG